MSEARYKLAIQLANLRFAYTSAFGTYKPKQWWDEMKAEIERVKTAMEEVAA